MMLPQEEVGKTRGEERGEGRGNKENPKTETWTANCVTIGLLIKADRRLPMEVIFCLFRNRGSGQAKA